MCVIGDDASIFCQNCGNKLESIENFEFAHN